MRSVVSFPTTSTLLFMGNYNHLIFFKVLFSGGVNFILLFRHIFIINLNSDRFRL